MATPTILFNTSTGSDTAASGAGPSTALSGTAASYSGSVFTLDGTPNLSGVATDGSHVIWVATSTGRQFFTINAVNDGADTVTVDDAPAGTTTGLTWGLGGKRNDFDATSNRVLFESDIKDSWIVETETAQTISSTISPTSTITQSGADAPTVRGSSGSRKTFTQTANAAHFTFASTNTDAWKFERLTFENTNGTKTSAYGFYHNMNGLTQYYVHDCEFGDATNQLKSGFSSNGVVSGRFASMEIVDSYIHDCTGIGWDSQGNVNCYHYILNSAFVENTSDIGLKLAGQSPAVLIGNLFANNGGDGCFFTYLAMGNYINGADLIINNTFSHNTGDGLAFSAWLGSPSKSIIWIVNNIFSNNTAYGIGGTAAAATVGLYTMRNNAFYNNTTAAIEEGDLVDVDGVTGTDPGYADSTNNDFSIGTALKALGLPDNIGKAGLTTSYTDIGAAQRQEPAGGASSVLGGGNLEGGFL